MKVPLCLLPTPISYFDKYSKKLGLDLFFKRDDLTGLGLGGNKLRKMEYILADAKLKGSQHLICMGGAQSNCCLQAAISAQARGFECTVILSGEKIPTKDFHGNLKMYQSLDTNMHFVKSREERLALKDKIITKLKSQGQNPYYIPVSALFDVGSVAYIEAMRELKQQTKEMEQEFDYIIVPTGTGGTLAGILAGAKMFDVKSKVIGIGIEEPDDMFPGFLNKENYKDELCKIANGALKKMDSEIALAVEDFDIRFDVAYDYGVMRDLERETSVNFTKETGIYLDPSYNSRAFAGFLKLVNEGEIQEGARVLYWFTGGMGGYFMNEYQFF